MIRLFKRYKHIYFLVSMTEYLEFPTKQLNDTNLLFNKNKISADIASLSSMSSMSSSSSIRSNIKKKNKQRDIGNEMPAIQQPKKLINPNLNFDRKKTSNKYIEEDIEIRSNKSGKSSYEDNDEEDDEEDDDDEDYEEDEEEEEDDEEEEEDEEDDILDDIDEIDKTVLIFIRTYSRLKDTYVIFGRDCDAYKDELKMMKCRFQPKLIVGCKGWLFKKTEYDIINQWYKNVTRSP